jgi:WD40 repeat protein
LTLKDVRIPEGAEERAWRVVRRAFEERAPTPSQRRSWRPVLVLVAVVAVAGVLSSPPGRALITSIREAVGVEKAQVALFSLPAAGNLLAQSHGGPWVVSADGSKRLLGSYREASWSPFGRFVVAARRNELLTMDPRGSVHWTLARPQVASPSWGGTRADTRIAYATNGGLRVVAGDGTGDRAACAGSLARVAPAWQPGSLRILASAAVNGSVRVYDVGDCRLLWRSPRLAGLRKLQWSVDGKLLLAVSPTALRVYDQRGHVVAQDDPSDATRDVDATFVGRTHRVAVIRSTGEVFDLRNGHVFFKGGQLGQVVSSPDGRWLLLTWPAADQWVFVGAEAPHRIRAVSGIGRQFGGGGFPSVSGWIGK